MGHGNQISSVLVAALDRDGVQGPERSRQIKVAAPETAVELLAARVDAGRFLFGESDEAVMVAAQAGRGSGRHQAEKRFLAGFVQPFHRAARLFHVGPPAGQIPAAFAWD